MVLQEEQVNEVEETEERERERGGRADEATLQPSKAANLICSTQTVSNNSKVNTTLRIRNAIMLDITLGKMLRIKSVVDIYLRRFGQLLR